MYICIGVKMGVWSPNWVIFCDFIETTLAISRLTVRNHGRMQICKQIALYFTSWDWSLAVILAEFTETNFWSCWHSSFTALTLCLFVCCFSLCFFVCHRMWSFARTPLYNLLWISQVANRFCCQFWSRQSWMSCKLQRRCQLFPWPGWLVRAVRENPESE